MNNSYITITFIFKDGSTIDATFQKYIAEEMFTNKKIRREILKNCSIYKIKD